MKAFKVTRLKVGFGIGSAFLVTLLSAGCGSGYGGGGGYTGLGTLNSIAITPSSEIVSTGTTARLTAIGTYANGMTADLTTSVTWTSAASGVASVGAHNGIVTGNAAGTTDITASMNNGAMYGGNITSAADTVTVTTATLDALTIAPVTMSVAKGSTTTFSATGSFTDTTSGNVSGLVNWTSSDPSVATVGADGIATGIAAGTCTITASSDGISNVATLTVF